VTIALIVIFAIAYAAIALEHPIGINKSATALLGAGLLWTAYATLGGNAPGVADQLNESVGATAQIVFFLMGAMTIVEVIDAHNGFEIITSQIRTTKLASLMWLVSTVTFFLSSVLDNLTTTIVMIALMKKLLDDRASRLLFASMIVIAANAGGAWTVIGDVTTTMLWIGGQVTPLSIMKSTFGASMLNMIVPLLWVAFQLQGRQFRLPDGLQAAAQASNTTPFERHLMFWMGLGTLILVPAFKAATHLPPFMGILFGLGLLWVVGEIVHRDKEPDHRERLTLVAALKRIDMSSIVFFIGILLAVAALEHAQILSALAEWLDRTVGRKDVIVLVLGLSSAVIDNVPLVAATMGMYSLSQFPPDSFQWEFIAYCAGTGGSDRKSVV